MKVEVGSLTVALDEKSFSVAGPDFQASMTLWKDVEGKPVDVLKGQKIIVYDVPPYLTFEE
jgi:hypothetical protein